MKAIIFFILLSNFLFAQAQLEDKIFIISQSPDFRVYIDSPSMTSAALHVWEWDSTDWKWSYRTYGVLKLTADEFGIIYLLSSYGIARYDQKAGVGYLCELIEGKRKCTSWDNN